MVLEKTLESLLDCKEIIPVNLKGNQPWIFIGGTDPEAEAPILWPPDTKNRLIGKDPDVGRGFPDSSVGKESACNAGDHGSIPGSERSTEKGIGYPLQYSSASLVAQLVTNLPAVEETWVQSLAWEDPVEKGKATHSSILAWRIPWTVLYCIVHGVASSWTRLSDFQFHFHGCWERLKAGREGDNRGWDGWMTSPIPWTWVWTSYGRWWRTGKPGVLQSVWAKRIKTRVSNWTT